MWVLLYVCRSYRMLCNHSGRRTSRKPVPTSPETGRNCWCSTGRGTTGSESAATLPAALPVAVQRGLFGKRSRLRAPATHRDRRRTRRESPPKRYVRSFYHLPVHESRDHWVHTVTGTGEERGAEFGSRGSTAAEPTFDVDGPRLLSPAEQRRQPALDGAADAVVPRPRSC